MLDKSTQPGERYCLFRSGTSWFAMPAVCVQEVSFRPEVMPVPSAAAVLAGLCHFRNEFLAVLSLRRLLPDVASSTAPESQIVVVQGSDGLWALLVDEVAALETLDASSSLDSDNDDDWADVVTAWATFRDHSVRILDPDTFYRLAYQALHDSWNWAHPGVLSDQDSPLGKSFSDASRAAV
jgi:purine-binding chemotaxis protein CheW